MAVTVAELRALITADDAQYQQRMAAVLVTAERARSEATQMTSSFEALGPALLKAGAAMTAIGAAFGFLVKVGSDLQTELVHVAGNTSMSAAEFDNLQKSVIRLGATTPVAMDEIGRAYMQAANFGFHFADANNVVEAALKSAVATGASAEQTTRALAVAMHLFGIPASEAAVAMDVLHLAAARGGQTLEQFTTVTGRVFSVAHAMGVGLVDVAAAMSAMTQSGLSAAQAATALQGAIFKIVNPSKGAKEELARLSKVTGVDLVSDFSKAGLSAKGLSGVMEDIHKAVGNNTDAITKFLPAQRGALAAILLTTTAADDYKARLSELNDVISGKLTPTQKDYQRAMDTVGSQVFILSNQFKIFGFELLTALGPSLIGGLKALNEIGVTTLGFFAQLPPVIAIATASFVGAVGVVGTVSIALGALVALLGGPVTVAILAVGVEVGLFAAAIATNLGGINDAFKAWFGSVKISLVGVAGVLGSVVDAIAIFGRVAVGVFDVVGTSIRIFIGGVVALYPALSGLGKTLVGIATQDIPTLVEGLAGMGTAIKAGISDTIGQAGAFAGRELQRLQATADNLNGHFKDSFKSAAETAGAFGQNIADVAGRVKAAWDHAQDGLDNLANNTGKAGKKIKDETEKLIAAQLGLVNDWLKATGREIEISSAAWDLVPQATKQAFIQQAAAFHKSIEEAQAWKAQQLAIALTTGTAWAPALHLVLDAVDGLVPAVKDLGGVTEATNQIIADTEPYVRAQGAMQQTGGSLAILKAALKNLKEDIAASPLFDKLKMQDETARAFDEIIRIVQQSGERLGKTQEEINADVLAKIHQFDIDTQGAYSAAAQAASDAYKRGMDKLPGALDDIFNKLALGAKHQVAGIFDVINSIPGAFGDGLRKSTDVITKWISQIDGVLKGLHKIFQQIPDGLTGMIQQIIGIFQATDSTVAASESAISGSFDSMQKSAKAAAEGTTVAGDEIGAAMKKMGADGEEGASQLSAALGLAASSIGAFLTGHAIGGVKGALVGGLQGALSGFMVGGIFGAAIGGVAGILGGIFGGKSAAQKAAEAQQKEQAKISFQQSAQSVINSAIEGFDKALTFFDHLDEFTAPRKAKFQQFFKAFSKLMDYFLELSKAWATTSLTQAKAAAEAIGPIAQAISALPDAFAAINGHFGVAQSSIDSFFADFDKLMTAFFARSEVWIEGVSKRAMKVANRLTPVVALISGFASAITDIGKVVEPDESVWGIFDRTIDSIVTHVANISLKFDKAVLKVMANFADKAGSALTLWKDAVDAIKGMTDIPMPSDQDFANVFNGIEKVVAGMNALADRLSTDGLAKAQALATASLAIFASIKAGVEALMSLKDFGSVLPDVFNAFFNDFNAAVDMLTQMARRAVDFDVICKNFEQYIASGSASLAHAFQLLSQIMNAAGALFPNGSPVVVGGDTGTTSTTSSSSSMSTMSQQSTPSTTTNIHLGGITVSGDDPKAQAFLQALSDLLGVGSGLDSVIAQHS